MSEYTHLLQGNQEIYRISSSEQLRAATLQQDISAPIYPLGKQLKVHYLMDLQDDQLRRHRKEVEGLPVAVNNTDVG